MPSRDRVEEFIAVVVSGEHVRAITDFYHPDASMQENLEAPRKGREVLEAHEAAALARAASVHTHPAPAFVVDGDHVVINWTFDFTDKKGITRRLEELAFQQWDGDRIRTERFFYDTASAWTAIPITEDSSL